MDLIKTAKIPVLIIDDDAQIALVLSEYLGKFDFELQACQHPERGMALLAQGRHDLLLLDVMLPGMSGLQVCKLIRQSSDIPIIMLTARGDVKDKVMGFEHGADDYLAKPFEPRELIARMQRLLQRRDKAPQPKPSEPELGFIINSEKRQLLINNQTVDLTTIEFDILFLLSGNPGKVYARSKILQYVKGLNEGVMLQTRAIDNSISRLRRKLGRAGEDQQLIRTVWGQGYSFTGLEK
ncbi:MAG: response regulator transcription factor [Psychrosphaera sp.]|nr:response regulator transcription factor [Psychrosphaera sp.]